MAGINPAWADQSFPTRLQLDQAAPNNPVYLDHVSGHIAVANSLALKHAEINPDTPNPAGGEIARFADGEPNGLLKERATEMVTQRIPDPSGDERRKGIELVLQELAQNGVTSAQDFSTWEDFGVYNDLKLEKKLTVRITEWLPFTASTDDLQNMRAQGGTTDPWLKTGALKGFLDGALGTHTAALLAPYSDDPSTSGILTMDPEKVKAMAIERDRLGFQIAFHAIGDKANRVALDAFESLVRVNPPRDRETASSTHRLSPPRICRASENCRSSLRCSLPMRPMTCVGPNSASVPNAPKALTPGNPSRMPAPGSPSAQTTTSSPSILSADSTLASPAKVLTAILPAAGSPRKNFRWPIASVRTRQDRRMPSSWKGKGN